ncbi:MAG: alpha/beta fold hydrolase [Planctomycetota bacterium]
MSRSHRPAVAAPVAAPSAAQPLAHAGGAKEDWRALFPFEPQSFMLDGQQLRYIDTGAGPPVLMVHGNPTWSFYWHQLIARLAPEFRCLAPDHIGCGYSDKPQQYAYTLDQHINNLVRLVQHLDLRRATLIAHDWGGAIGMGTLLRMQDRFERIVLLNTAAFPPPYFPLRIRLCRFPLLGESAVRGLNLFARAATVMATERKGGLPAAVSAGLLAPYDNWANRIATYQFVRDIPTSAYQSTWQRLAAIEAQLPTLRQRKLLVWGMKEWCFRPECLRRFQDHWPDADVEERSRAGHYVLLDEPDVVIPRIQDFLLSKADAS